MKDSTKIEAIRMMLECDICKEYLAVCIKDGEDETKQKKRKDAFIEEHADHLIAHCIPYRSGGFMRHDPREDDNALAWVRRQAKEITGIEEESVLACTRIIAEAVKPGPELYDWEAVVIECEQILGLKGHAESPLNSNLSNAVRDLKAGMFPRGRKEEEIITCPECKGFGKREKEEIVNHHNNIIDCWDEECKNCDNRGRVVLETIKIIRKLTDKELALRPKPKEE